MEVKGDISHLKNFTMQDIIMDLQHSFTNAYAYMKE